MRNDERNILAITPGTRFIGIAVFLGTELRDWAVKVIRNRKVLDVVSKYCERYNIQILASKKLHPSRSSKELQSVSKSIKTFAKENKLDHVEFSISDLKQILLSSRRGNKRQLMEELVSRYPFLNDFVPKPRESKLTYVTRMFEAIGIGEGCLRKVDGSTFEKLKD